VEKILQKVIKLFNFLKSFFNSKRNMTRCMIYFVYFKKFLFYLDIISRFEVFIKRIYLIRFRINIFDIFGYVFNFIFDFIKF